MTDTHGGEFTPRFTLDLHTANAQNFSDLTEEFERWRATLGALPPLKIKSGWHNCNQEVAEQWLLRNLKGANRKPSYGTVVYYAAQQDAGKWAKTGQPIIFDVNGVLIDGQQRLFGCYLGNTKFTTYVVTDAPDIPELFAYIDNSKPRNAATALSTAGLNGLASLVAQTVQIVKSFDAHAYTSTSKKRMP